MKKQILLTLAFAIVSNTCFAVTADQVKKYVWPAATLVGNLAGTAALAFETHIVYESDLQTYHAVLKVAMPLLTALQATVLARSAHQIYKSARRSNVYEDTHATASTQAQVPCKN